MRLLGIDYGTRRIGVAVSDELGITARALCTIVRKTLGSDLEKIAGIAREKEVQAVVIGYPRRLNGREGVECERVSRFARRLEESCGLPVIAEDESFTSKDAEEILLEANMSRKKRKEVIDRVSAMLILQKYLDKLNCGKVGADDER